MMCTHGHGRDIDTWAYSCMGIRGSVDSTYNVVLDHVLRHILDTMNTNKNICLQSMQMLSLCITCGWREGAHTMWCLDKAPIELKEQKQLPYRLRFILVQLNY
jgi:hypothetical protein